MNVASYLAYKKKNCVQILTNPHEVMMQIKHDIGKTF